MAHLLHLDSSPRSQRSHSRQLSCEFVEAWKHVHPSDRVTYRDIGRTAIPHVDEAWIAAAYTPADQRSPELQQAIDFSDRLVNEFLAADIYVLGVPMYNFSIPSGLKAYIDQIVRIGRTFAFNPANSDHPYQPLVLGKQMVIIAARGSAGFGVGGAYEQLNYQTPYLATIFGFIGITDITLIEVEHDETGGQALTDALQHARARIADLIQQSCHAELARALVIQP